LFYAYIHTSLQDENRYLTMTHTNLTCLMMINLPGYSLKRKETRPLYWLLVCSIININSRAFDLSAKTCVVRWSQIFK